MPKKTRADEIIDWIHKYCVRPYGAEKGLRVRLTPAEMSRIREIYDDDDLQSHHAEGELAAYLALVHTCGIEATETQLPLPKLEVDLFSVWNAAANPDLLRVLKREPDAVVCPALGTRFPTRAA